LKNGPNIEVIQVLEIMSFEPKNSTLFQVFGLPGFGSKFKIELTIFKLPQVLG